MTDRMKSPNGSNPHKGTQRGVQVKNKKTLDTCFPSTLLLVSMVGIVLLCNIIAGVKIFTLEKEKNAVERQKEKYESHAKIIREVEEFEERLSTLKREIVPYEMRAENAQKSAKDSDERLKKNKDERDRVKADKTEIIEKLNSAHSTLAELSNDKKTLRREKVQLGKIVAELKIEQEVIEKTITVKRQRLRVAGENIAAAEVRLEDQKRYLKDVAAANSSFEMLRTQLVEFVRKMEETQSSAGNKVKDFTGVVAGVVEQKNQLATHAEKLALETDRLTQSNVDINAEIKGLRARNIDYTSEIDKVIVTSGEMESVAEGLKESVASMEIDEALLNNNATLIKNNLEQVTTVNKELGQKSEDLTKVVAGVVAQKNQLASQSEKLILETDSFSQSNATMSAEVKELYAQNINYKSEVDKLAATSGQMGSVAEDLKGTSANLKTDEAQLIDNAKKIKSNLGEVATAAQGLDQISKKFALAVAGVTSQRESLDIYLQKIADLPDMDAQVTAFNDVLKDINDVAQLLSEKVSAIQSSFDGKLNGMELSFGIFEKDFVDLSLKIDGVEQTLKKIAIRTQKMNLESPKI